MQPRFTRSSIHALQDGNGDIVTDESDIKQVATTYYSKLLTAEPITSEIMGAR